MKYNHIDSLINEFDIVCRFCFSMEAKNEEASFKKCFEMAWNDCNQGYRYLGGRFKNKKEIVFEYLKKYFEKERYVIPTELISEVEKLFKFAIIDKRTEFGAAQKIVNMLLKYLFLYQDFTGKKIIDYSKLDCPLDSIILTWVDGYENTKWTRLTRDTYKEIQEKIKELIKNEADGELKDLSKICGNLAFDFFRWPNKRDSLNNK